MFHKQETLSTVVKKSIQRLIKPWVLWSIIAIVIGLIISVSKGKMPEFLIGNVYSLVITGAVSENPPLWFLFSLFIVRVLYSSLRRLNISEWLIILSCLSLSYLLSFVVDFKPYYICNVLLGTFFYALGYKVGNKVHAYSNIGLSLLVIPTTIVFFYFPNFVDFRTNTILEGFYLIYCLMSFLAIVGWNSIFKILEKRKINGGCCI